MEIRPELIELCRKGDKRAEQELYKLLYGFLMSICRRYIRQEEMAREILNIGRKVDRAGSPVELTAREFELLEYLMRNKGQTVPRDTLARDVWKETDRGTPLNNVIDVHIARLRRKVDPEGLPKLIHTVRGVGFTLREKAL
jgi:DNA-binding response OmpR family regulator